MKVNNILAVLFMLMVSQSVVATVFTVYNEVSPALSNRSGISYNPVWKNTAQGWRELWVPNSFDSSKSSNKDNSYLGKIQDMWWCYDTVGDKRVYYFIDLEPYNIPVARAFGVVMRIRDEGQFVLECDGKQNELTAKKMDPSVAKKALNIGYE